MRIRLRAASPSDARLLWTWVNDPATRRSAFRRAPVPWKRHQAWFAARLARPGTRLYVAVAGGRPVGQVRFDRLRAGVAEIDVSVAPASRGRGLGRRLILLGSQRALRELRLRRVVAAVRTENLASQAAFVAAGYRRLRRARRLRQPCVLFAWGKAP